MKIKHVITHLITLLLLIIISKVVYSEVVPEANVILPRFSYGLIANDIKFSIQGNSILNKFAIEAPRTAGNFGVLIYASNGIVQASLKDYKSQSIWYYVILFFMSTFIILGTLYGESVPKVYYGNMRRSKYIRMRGLKAFFALWLKNLKDGFIKAIDEFTLSWYWYILKVIGLAWALDIIHFVAKDIFGIFPK